MHSDTTKLSTSPSSPAAPLPVTIGTLLDGKLRIEQALGEGGMSHVYLAHDVVLDRPVAIKLLSRELLDEARWRDRLQPPRRPSASSSPKTIPRSSARRACCSRSRCPRGRAWRASPTVRALEAWEASHFDILLLDLHMPWMGALDVAAAMTATDRPRPRIIVMSAQGGAEDGRELRALGVDAMVLKPFDIDDVVSIIERMTATAAEQNSLVPCVGEAQARKICTLAP